MHIVRLELGIEWVVLAAVHMHIIAVCFQAPQVDVGSGHPGSSAHELPMGLWVPADQVGVGFIAHEGIEPISHHHIALPITQHVHLLADTM